MSTQPPLAALSLPRKLVLGAGVLLFIDSLLPWYHLSAFGRSFSASGWHGIGPLIWIILLVVLAWEVARLAGLVALDEDRAGLGTAVGTGVVVVLGIIFFIARVIGSPGTGIGGWIGLVLLLILGYAAFVLFTTSGGQEAIQAAQRQAADRRAAGQRQAPGERPAAGERPAPTEPPAADGPSAPTEPPVPGQRQDPPGPAA